MKKLNYAFLILISSVFIIAFATNFISSKATTNNAPMTNNLNSEEMEKYLVENPEDTEILKNLAFSLIVKNDNKKVIELLEKAAPSHKNDTEILHLLVRAYMGNGEYEKAKEKSEELLKFNNFNGVALINLAQINFLLGNQKRFNENIDQALEAAEVNELDEFETKFYNNLGEKILDYRNLLEKDKSYEAYIYLAGIDVFDSPFILSALKLALENTDDAVESEILERKGKLELETQNLDQAIKTFQLLIETHPDNEYGYILLADAYFKNKDFEKLEELQYSSSSLNQPNNFINILNMFNTNNKQQAIDALIELLEKSDNKFETVYLYNLIYFMKASNQTKESQTYIEQLWNSDADLDYLFAIQKNLFLQQEIGID